MIAVSFAERDDFLLFDIPTSIFELSRFSSNLSLAKSNLAASVPESIFALKRLQLVIYSIVPHKIQTVSKTEITFFI